MAENVGNIHIEADLARIRRREAAAIQSLEGKILGISPPGCLGPAAQSAANENENFTSMPIDKEPVIAPDAANIDPNTGKATQDFGAVKLEVDLNRVTPVEADALEAAERKIEGENPLLEVGGIGAAAKTMANFNQRDQAGLFNPGPIVSNPQSKPTSYFQEVVVQPPPMTVYVPIVGVSRPDQTGQSQPFGLFGQTGQVNPQGPILSQPNVNQLAGYPQQGSQWTQINPTAVSPQSENQRLLSQPIEGYDTQGGTVGGQNVFMSQRSSEKVTTAQEQAERTRVNLTSGRGD
ncbi:uncharacterized protein LOC136037152 [Artemia franciscana]|uniref:Uncharacterized protein n=1 Tax=Artemia franciscana TaxID=6661 RepID=A0AA88HXY6_ARTSF|nr:hypothetical protein QYM36_010743 [Artemia franciscana]